MASQELAPRASVLEPFQIEPSVSAAYTLDDDEEAALLLAPPLGDAASGAAAADQRSLKRAVSRFQLASEDVGDSWASYRHEAARMAELALPLTISQFFTFALGLLTVAFIGRLGEEQMAVAVLATSFSNVTGFSVVLGLLGALDTLCGQAWGAKNYRALGVNLQRALVTTVATCAAIGLLWAHVEPLMLAVGQHEAIAAGAARFLLLSIPALLCAGVFECSKRYLMSQGVVKPVTAVSCAAVALAPLFNWLFIFKWRLGLDGAVFAQLATWLAMLLMLLVFQVWYERRRLGTPQQTWHGWSRECLKGLGTYYRLAVPSMAGVVLEWWAYEITIFMAGWLPNPTLHVAAQGAMMQVSGCVYMLPMALSCAASVRVSNALGANLPHAARRSAHTAAGMTAITQASLAAALVLGRNHWAGVFTNLEEVIRTCAAAFPIMSLCMFGDGFNATIGGVLRGAGRQELGALLNLCSYWGLGLPAAYLLAIKAGWELKGLWAGLVLCTSVQGVVMLVVLYRFNWNKEAARAVALVAANGSSSSLAHGGADDAALARTEDSAAKLHLDKEGGSDSPSIPALHSGSGSSSTAAGREQ